MIDSPLPTGHVSFLGTLSLERVYEHYDFPRLFHAKNKSDQHFLCLCIDDEIEECLSLYTKWLYAPISSKRLSLIEQDRFSLRDAFKKVEGGYCILLEQLDLELKSCQEIAAHDIDDFDLPYPGVYLECEHLSTTPIPDALQQAHAYNSEAFNIHLKSPKIKGMDIPLSVLSGFSSKFQDLVNAIAQCSNGSSASRGRISETVIGDAELLLTGTFSGSFGAQLVSKKQNDLFNSEFSEIIDKLFQIIDAGDEEETLVELMKGQNQRVASRYLQFLRTIKVNELNSRFEWASSFSGITKQYSIDSQIAENAIKHVSKIEENLSKIIRVRAELRGWSHNTGRFEARTSQENYRGTISEDLLETQPEPVIYSHYAMEIEESTESGIMSGDRKKYILRALEKSPENS